MAHRARTVEVRQHDALTGGHPPIRGALAPAVRGAARTTTTGRVLEGDRPTVEPDIDEGRVEQRHGEVPPESGALTVCEQFPRPVHICRGHGESTLEQKDFSMK